MCISVILGSESRVRIVGVCSAYQQGFVGIPEFGHSSSVSTGFGVPCVLVCEKKVLSLGELVQRLQSLISYGNFIFSPLD